MTAFHGLAERAGTITKTRLVSMADLEYKITKPNVYGK